MPEPEKRRKCDGEKSKPMMSKGPHHDEGAACSISPGLVHNPSVICSPITLGVSEMESSPRNARSSNLGTLQVPFTECGHRVSNDSFQISHEQTLMIQESTCKKLPLGQRYSQDISPTVVPETSESSVEITEVMGGSCLAADDDAKVSSSKTKRQRKRMRQKKRKLTQRACTAATVPYQ